MADEQIINSQRKSLKVLFLGQCMQYGYIGVDKSSTYISLAVSNLAARFPQLKLRLDLKHLYHPKGLNAILKHRLFISRPDIVVIGVPGIFAVTYTRVNLIYEIAPEVVDTARSFLQKIEAKVAGRGNFVKSETPIDKLFAWHAPLALEEYERLIREGIELCQAAGCQVILLGPGRFNEDNQDNFTIQSAALWSSVNAMVAGLSKSTGVPMIDSMGALSDYGGEVFMPNNIRWSPFGHQIVAREVEQVLASNIISFLNTSPI
ncbi:MAG: hypothetical protein V7641_1526 [Blastocatellia bacterium]